MYVLAILFIAVPRVLCRHNVTVDDQDSSIVYNPRSSWTLSANSSLDVGGAHMLTQDPSATATFTFTGVAVYYMAPLWPYTVNTAVSLDHGPAILLDLVDHSRANTGQGSETVQSQVIWGSEELSNTPHTLVISVGTGQPYAVVDAFIYTALDPSDVTTSLLSTSSGTTSTNRISSSSSSTLTSTEATATTTALPGASQNVLHIALGTVFGVLALLLVVLGVWFFVRRRRRPKSEAWTVPGYPYPPDSPPATRPMSRVHIVNGSGDYAFSSGSQPSDYSHGTPAPGVIPGTMAPVLHDTYAYPSVAEETRDDGWQGTTAQIAQRYMQSHTRYQPRTLSPIAESSPQGTPLAQSPSSQTEELPNSRGGANTTSQNLGSPSIPIHRTQPPAYYSQ